MFRCRSEIGKFLAVAEAGKIVAVDAVGRFREGVPGIGLRLSRRSGRLSPRGMESPANGIFILCRARPCCEDEAGGDTGSRAGRHAGASLSGGGPAAHDVLSLLEHAPASPQGAAVRACTTDSHEGRAAGRSLAPLPILGPSSARCAFRGERRQ